MFYIKEPVDFHEIGEGASITIGLAERKICCTCPGCGADIEATPYEITNDLVLHKSGEAAYCAECSTKLVEAREAANKVCAQAEALKKWIPDNTRDKLPAVSVLWDDYRYSANSIGEDHVVTKNARQLLERVMVGPLANFREEIQCCALAMLASCDDSVEDATEGDEELTAFYRRVLGMSEEA